MKRSEAVKTNYAGLYYYIEKATKAKVYIARIKINGIDTEQVVGRSDDKNKTNAMLANQRRLELMLEAKKGKSILKTDNPTLNELFEKYMETKAAKIVRSKFYRGYYEKHIKEALGDKRIAEIKLSHLQKLIDAMIAGGYKPTNAKNIRDVLSGCYKLAIQEGILQDNIVKNIEFPKYDNNRYFNLDDEARYKLVETIDNIPLIHIRVMFKMLLRGRRKGEVIQLRWSDIDFQNKKITIREENQKTRERLEFFLDDEIFEELEALYKKREQDEWVFWNTGTKARYKEVSKKWFERIKKDSGVSMRMHDFRHLLGFSLVNAGIPLEFIGKALGHKKTSTTQKYSNIKAEIAKQATDTYLEILKKKS